MADDNKWSKPSNPPPPLFLGESERNLVKQVNDELIERVIGQAIIYLPISMERTNFHPLYGEAIEKSFLPPVRVYALVEFEGITTTTDHYGLDEQRKVKTLDELGRQLGLSKERVRQIEISALRTLRKIVHPQGADFLA